MTSLLEELGVEVPLISTKTVANAAKKKIPSVYVSGFCTIGNCEGTEHKSPSGKEMKACPGAINFMGNPIICTHECHMLSRELENMAPMTEDEEDVFSSLSIAVPVSKKKDAPAIPRPAESPELFIGDIL